MKKLQKPTRNEGLLVFGNWTSCIGNILFDYVNSVYIVAAFTTSSWILALYQSSETIIQLIFNLIGGAIADSGKRKRIIIIADFISAIVCFVASFFLNGSAGLMATAIIIANAILALVHAFSSPCFKAIIRDLIKKDRIKNYNSINNAGAQIIKMVGPALGVAAVLYVGASVALIIDAITFLISAISECFLVELEKKEEDNHSSKKNILLDIKDGFKYLWSRKTIFLIVMIASVINLFLAGYNLLLPYTDVIFAGTFSNFYAKARVCEAIGAILGALLNTKIPKKIAEDFKGLMFFISLMGIFLALIPLLAKTNNIILCLTPFALSMGSLTIFNINYMTFVQVHVDQNYLGRVFSIIFTCAVLFVPIGAFLFSFMNITASIYGFLVPGLGPLIIAILAMIFIHPITSYCISSYFS